MRTSLRIGGIEVVLLLDGVGDLDDPGILDPDHGPGDPAWAPARAAYPGVFAPGGGWRLHVRAALVHARGRTVLVDTGVGGSSSPAMGWFPAPGRLPAALAEAGTDPGEVEVVVLTHVHEDHIGGTVTAGGEPAFPNARYLLHRLDLAWQERLASQTPEDRAIWERLLAPLRARGVLQAVDDAHPVLPGVRTRHLPGHTPGHQAVEVGDGGASLLLSGDAINHPAQLRDPALATGPDDDVEAALAVRRRLIGELVASGRPLAPPHFAEPFGRLVADPAGDARWLPLGRGGQGAGRPHRRPAAVAVSDRHPGADDQWDGPHYWRVASVSRHR